MAGAFQEKKSIVYVFLSLEGNRFSRTLNYYHGIQKLGLVAHWFEINPRRKNRGIRDVVRNFRFSDVVFVVASPSHVLVPYLRVRTRRKVVLDAGWPLYDGVIQSRREFGILGWRLFLTFSLDFLAFHFANTIFLETCAQIDACRRRYLLPENKLFDLATGFDENRFKGFGSTTTSIRKPQDPIVLFRGGPQDEAGLQVLFEAIKYVNTSNRVRFVVISKLKIPEAFNSENLEVISDFQDDLVLWNLYREAVFVLGQLSNHSRLDKTLPHKFFEAGFFKKAYVTSDRGVIGNYVKTNEVVGFKAGNAIDLARKLNELLSSPKQIDFLGNSISGLYMRNFAQDILTRHFLKCLS